MQDDTIVTKPLTTSEQVYSLCHFFPAEITATELLGLTYMLLDGVSGVAAKVRFLADHVENKAQMKLQRACDEVMETYDSLSFIESFSLGSVYVSEDDLSRARVAQGDVYRASSFANYMIG